MSEKLKVLYVCEGAAFAGAEKYAISLIEKLSQLNDIELFLAVLHDGKLNTMIRNLKINVIRIDRRSKIRTILQIRNLVVSHNIRVVHLNDLVSTIIGCTALLFLNEKVAIVSTLHGMIENKRVLFSNVKYGLSVLVYCFYLLVIVDKIIVVSKDLMHVYSKVFSINKLKVIHNGLNLKCCDSLNDQQSCIRQNGLIVGTIGRLDIVKGHVYLIQAARQILNIRGDVVFYIVGSGPLADELRRVSIELDVLDRVRFLGFRSDPLPLLADMDIFVLPSLHEGIPFALLEAMSLCKAVVCSDVGGIKEVIDNGVDGILVPPKDSFALANAILFLLEESGYRVFLGRNARNKVERAFCSNDMVQATYNLYANSICLF